MTIVNVFGSRMVLVTNPVSWSDKAMYLKRYPSGLKTGIGRQKEWRGVFARAALSTFGHSGKASYKGKSLPRPAVEIAAAIAGRGNKAATEQAKTAAAQARHAAASARWGGGGGMF